MAGPERVQTGSVAEETRLRETLVYARWLEEETRRDALYWLPVGKGCGCGV